jgi:hypothetical protein
MCPGDDEPGLLKYFIQKTDERFTAVEKRIDDSLKPIVEKLDDLTKFKIEMVVNAKWVALIISSACGIISLVISVTLSIYLSKQEREATLREISSKNLLIKPEDKANVKSNGW